MFARKWCGTDFFDAMAKGEIKLSMYDLDRTYQVMSKHTRVDGSRGSSVTVQFSQTHVAEADMPWAKKTGNNQKKDQFFMSIHGIPESWDESKESACFNLMMGVLPAGEDMKLDYSACASTQRDAGY